MFIYKRTIRMDETDAAGRIYFAIQFNLFHEAYEAMLAAKGLSFAKLLRTKKYFVPIVHAEGNYNAPLFVSDPITVRVSLTTVGTTSFSMSYDVRNARNQTVGSGKLVHVAVDRKTNKKIKLPTDLRKILARLQ